jgi:hypothetical protein
MSGNVPSPAERLQKAADGLNAASKANTHRIHERDVRFFELVACLLEGMAAHWATRPIADWNDYAITPLAALERHINGEEADR